MKAVVMYLSLSLIATPCPWTVNGSESANCHSKIEMISKPKVTVYRYIEDES